MTIADATAAIAYVNHKPNPLALYWFGKDKQNLKRVLSETRSGGVTVNDTLLHITIEDLPFGGVGASGIGSYHGKAGFLYVQSSKIDSGSARFLWFKFI